MSLNRDREESDRLIRSLDRIKSVLIEGAFDSSDDSVRDDAISFLHDLNDITAIVCYLSENKLIDND